MGSEKILRHIWIPAIAPATFFLVAAMPVEVLGCRNRGLLALLIALVSVLAGLAAAVRGVQGRRRREVDSGRWTVSALILAIPAVALIFLA